VKTTIFALLFITLVVALGVMKLPSTLTPAYRPEPMLGIAVDKNLRVIAIEPNSPALKVGVEIGDLLLDLTWFSFSNNIRRDSSMIDKSPIPFSDRQRIRALMDYEYLLKLRVQRGSQILEFTIQPTVPIWRKYSEPTPTPLWGPDTRF
jgi:hypothetical protein